MIRHLSVGLFLLCMMFFAMLWWLLKPVIDMFTTDLLGTVAADFGITAQELAYFSILPFVIGGTLAVYMVLALVRRRKGGGE